MEIIFLLKAIFLFSLGTILGSFMNVFVDRGERKESLMGNSHCDFCGKELRWFENVPVLGYFIVRGKCSGCKRKLSFQYPLVEFLTGVVFLLVGYSSKFIFSANFEFWSSLEVLYLLAISFILSAIFLWDLKYMIIPNKLVLTGLIITISYLLIDYLREPTCSVFSVSCFFMENLLGGLIVSGFFYALFFISKGKWIGGGDVKIGFWLGFLVGWKYAYPFLLIAYVLGAVVSLALLKFSKKGWKSQVPFGPFLIGSFFTFLFFEEKLLYLYKLLF